MDNLIKLSESDRELVLKAPLLVGILIAGADGKIDRKEINQAVSFITKNTVSADLQYLMSSLSTDVEEKLQILISSYPSDKVEREVVLVKELEKLNDLLPLLERIFATNYYLMLKSLAYAIASSSGGVLGIKSIAAEEAKYTGLPMISDPSRST